MAYRVTAPLVVARQDNGTDVYLYAGSPVPETVGKDELKRLSEGGFIESEKVAAAAAADEAPAKSATKDEWVAYAEAHGDAEASSKTKDELIAAHGA